MSKKKIAHRIEEEEEDVVVVFGKVETVQYDTAVGYISINWRKGLLWNCFLCRAVPLISVKLSNGNVQRLGAHLLC